MSRHLLKTTILWVVLFVLSLGVTTQASAHAKLVRTDPPDNSILPQAPGQFRFWFNEPISPKFSTVKLLDINGNQVPVRSIITGPDDPTLLILSLNDLPDGVYSIGWRVLSATDGHFTEGLVVFGVGENASLSSTNQAGKTETVPLPEVLLRWLTYLGLLGMGGGLAALLVVLRIPPNTVSEAVLFSVSQARQKIRQTIWLSAGLVFIAGIGLLAWQVFNLQSTLPEGTTPWQTGWELATRTRWGNIWLVRQLIVLGVFVAWHRLRPTERSTSQDHSMPPTFMMLLTVVGLVVVAVSVSLNGHSAGLYRGAALAVTANSLHILFASTWVGCLVVLVISLLPHIRQLRGHLGELFSATWKNFSVLAAISVGLLGATGLISLSRQAATLDAILTTLYGKALIGKIVLVLLAGLAGFCNNTILDPTFARWIEKRFRKPADWYPLLPSHLPRLAAIEAGLGIAIILFTAVITSASPARGPEFSLSLDDLPDSITQNVDDLIVNFAVKPNQPGPNITDVRVTSTRRPAPAEVLRIIVRLTYLEQDYGQISGDASLIGSGLYRMGGNHFSLPGAWKVDVVVRRRGIPDSIASFTWNVAPSGPPRSIILSNRPLETIFNIIAILLIVVTGAAGFTGWLNKRKQHAA